MKDWQVRRKSIQYKTLIISWAGYDHKIVECYDEIMLCYEMLCFLSDLNKLCIKMRWVDMILSVCLREGSSLA